MRVIVDQLSVREFYRRGGSQDEVRFYYQVIGYDCLLLITWQQPFGEIVGTERAAFWDFDTADPQLMHRDLHNVPARWQEIGDVIVATLKPRDWGRRGRRRIRFSEEIREKIGREC